MINREVRTAQLLAEITEQVATYVASLQEEMSLVEVETAVQRWKDQVGTPVLSRTLAAMPAHEEGWDCVCGQPCQRQGVRGKWLRTLQGRVRAERPYWYCAACQQGYAPWDARMGVVGTQTSAGVQREAAWRAARLTLAETAADLERAYPLRISARQVEALVVPVGHALATAEATHAAAAQVVGETPAWRPTQRWYVELDGVFARMRRGSVPMTAEEHLATNDVYREIKVGIIGRAERGREQTHLAAGVRLDTVPAHHVIAHRTDAAHFGPLVYAALVRAGWQDGDEVIVVSDGAHWIWHLVSEYLPDATQIVDLFHAREHLWAVARALAAPSTAAQEWVSPLLTHLEQGQTADVIATLHALAQTSTCPASTRLLAATAAQYFTYHAHRMQYAAFRARGLMIGSGLAEAGCKSVVSTRLKRSGMRWTPQGIDALLPVRTAVLNHTYDSWWQSQHHCLVA